MRKGEYICASFSKHPSEREADLVNALLIKYLQKSALFGFRAVKPNRLTDEIDLHTDGENHGALPAGPL